MNIAQRLAWPGAAARLVVRCLGRFRLETAGGSTAQPRTRKARAILACLATGGRPMSRDALADLLWSDRAPPQARSSVRQAIFELQHLGGPDLPLLDVSRDQVAVRADAVTTDLELIRGAAEQCDWPRLAALLADSEPGLLVDLDGLDREFDCWLRTERAQEPSRTLSAVIEAAEQCRAEAGPSAALALLEEVVRLDPANEKATRLALAIDHELGDQAALHRHFKLLGDRLREDYDAEPSAETLALFKKLANGGPIPSVEALAALPADSPAAASEHPSQAQRRARSPLLAPILVLVLAVAALAALVLADRRPAGGDVPVLVAVLPFEEQPRGDGFLAGGIWEHTRASLTRSGGMQVLGRVTSKALAEQRIDPADSQRRFGVTHLLEGIVRRSGDQLQVSVSLSRTSDGVSVWQAMFNGRMDEPLAFQDRIANGIEGRLRGRLARNGGRRAEEIATTPEVHALFSEARELFSGHQRENRARAEALLRRAVEKDPNWAPAWALLGGAINRNGRLAIVDAERRKEARAAVQHALALAPNLALAHANLALLEGLATPAAEQALRRALAFDPGYAEAWNWLGITLYSQNRRQEAVAAYRRAVELDPLNRPAVQNLAAIAAEAGDEAALAALLRDARRAGSDPILIGSIQANRSYIQGDYSGSLRVLEGLGLDANGNAPQSLWLNWLQSLAASGQFDRLHAVTGCPEWYAPLLRGEVLPPTHYDGKPVAPEEFWTSRFFSHPAARAMVRHGRDQQLVALYRAAFRDAEDFVARTGREGLLAGLAPTLATALKETGSAGEAAYLLAAAAAQLEPALKRPGGRWAAAELAAVRSAQGEHGQALALLSSALRAGWLPDGRQQALDLAQEPAFTGLRGNPRFEAQRKRVLDHIAREQRELKLAAA